MNPEKNMQKAFHGVHTNTWPPGKFLSTPELPPLWRNYARDPCVNAPPIHFCATGPMVCAVVPQRAEDAGLDLSCMLTMEGDAVCATWPPPGCRITFTDMGTGQEGTPQSYHTTERFCLRLYPRSRAFLKAGLAPRGFFQDDGAIDRFHVYDWTDKVTVEPESVSCYFNIVHMERFATFVNGNFSRPYHILQLVATYAPETRYPFAHIPIGKSMLVDIQSKQEIKASGAVFFFMGGSKGKATRKIKFSKDFNSVVVIVPHSCGFASPGVIDASYDKPFVVCSSRPISFTLREFMMMQWNDLNGNMPSTIRYPPRKVKIHPDALLSSASETPPEETETEMEGKCYN